MAKTRSLVTFYAHKCKVHHITFSMWYYVIQENRRLILVFVFPRIQYYLEAYDDATLAVGRLVAINNLWYIKKYQDHDTSFDEICLPTSLDANLQLRF